jgi:phosphate acyltransferase
VTATVSVDAMGGDRAPAAVVAGAARAAREGVRVLLCGPAATVADELERCGGPAGVEVVDAPDTIGAGEGVKAVRAKPASSLVTCCRLVREGRAQAAVSAGSTGAMLAASLFELRRLPTVARPAIAAVLPAQRGPCVLIDAGANAEARLEHLVQFAVMGAVFAEEVLGISRPPVALLSIGEEASKGTPVTLAAHARLEASGLHFVGNREGRDALRGDATVLVADGFAGNVLLKGMEGAAAVLFEELGAAARSSLRAKAGAALLLPALRGVRHRMHPDTYGGAYLLGLRGLAVIAHGSSGPDAVANAVRYAARGAEAGVVDRVGERLAGERAAWDLRHADAEHTVRHVSPQEPNGDAQG